MSVRGWLALRFHTAEHEKNMRIARALPLEDQRRFASVIADVHVLLNATGGSSWIGQNLLKNWLLEFGKGRVASLVKGASSRNQPEWLAYSMLETWATVALVDARAQKSSRRANSILADLRSLAATGLSTETNHADPGPTDPAPLVVPSMSTEEAARRVSKVAAMASRGLLSTAKPPQPIVTDRPVRRDNLLYPVANEAMTADFRQCWIAAGQHLEAHGTPSWLKAEPYPPYLEHLSFRLVNQLFFVRLEDVDSQVNGPGTRESLRVIADGCGGWPCLMPMRRSGAQWMPAQPGWGLVDLRTSGAIDPPSTITTVPIEMSDWEVQDFAVQIVRDDIKNNGCEILSSQGNPKVDPAIWYVEGGKPAWVVVRSVRFPALAVDVPHNWRQIAQGCREVSEVGYFASVAVAGGQERVGEQADIRLLRGHPLYAKYEGLIRPSVDEIDAAEEEFIGRGRLASRHRRRPMS